MTGDELKALREGLGLRQRDIAEHLGVSYQSYQRFERYRAEEAKIPAGYYSKLAEILNVVVDSFIPKTSASSVSSNASGGSTAISAGRDVSNQQNGEGVKLTAKERQALQLKKKYDPAETLLSGYIEKLLKIKSIHEG